MFRILLVLFIMRVGKLSKMLLPSNVFKTKLKVVGLVLPVSARVFIISWASGLIK